MDDCCPVELDTTCPEALQKYLKSRDGLIRQENRDVVYKVLLLGRADGYSSRAQSQQSIEVLESSILNTTLDLDNQRVIRADILRTRPGDELFKLEGTRDLLTSLITYFCKERGVHYKQGLHEVLAPFIHIFLQKRGAADPPVADIYLCFRSYLDRFLPYAYSSRDDEFLGLQICFRLFRLLLLYHHPRLCRLLDDEHLQPELYATPWFITLLSSSLSNMECVSALWDSYLCWNDPSLHHFVVLALVMQYSDRIMREKDISLLPEIMVHLPEELQTAEDVHNLVENAKQLMQCTPKSFRKNLSCALYSHLSEAQLQRVLQSLSCDSCVPIAAEEIVSSLFGLETADCGRQYMILDCRPKIEFNKCHLIASTHMDPSLRHHTEEREKFIVDLLPLRCVAHICLIGEEALQGKSSDLSGEAMGIVTASLEEGGSGRNSGKAEKAKESVLAFFRGGSSEGDQGADDTCYFSSLLQAWDFPYISYVRGNMSACLLSLQSMKDAGGKIEGLISGTKRESWIGVQSAKKSWFFGNGASKFPAAKDAPLQRQDSGNSMNTLERIFHRPKLVSAGSFDGSRLISSLRGKPSEPTREGAGSDSKESAIHSQDGSVTLFRWDRGARTKTPSSILKESHVTHTEKTGERLLLADWMNRAPPGVKMFDCIELPADGEESMSPGPEKNRKVAVLLEEIVVFEAFPDASNYVTPVSVWGLRELQRITNRRTQPSLILLHFIRNGELVSERLVVREYRPFLSLIHERFRNLTL